VRPAAATDFFVRVAGSDDGDGLTPATAFASIRRAAAAIRNPGDRVIVGPGTYVEGDITPAWNGISGRPIEFVADRSGSHTDEGAGEVIVTPPPERTTGFHLAGNRHVVIDGFTVVGAYDAAVQTRATVDGEPSGEIRVRNVHAHGGAKAGFDIVAVGHVWLEGNRVGANGSAGIAVQGCVATSVKCRAASAGTVLPVITDNVVEGNAANGIFVADASQGLVARNEIAGNGMAGILVRESDTISVLDNTVADNGQGGVLIGADVDAPTVGRVFTVSGNTIENNGRLSGIKVNAPEGGPVVVEHNRVLGHGATGIIVESADTPVTPRVSNNTVGQSGADGVLLIGTRAGVLQNNVVFGSAGSGLAVRAAHELLVVNNLAYANGEDGVTVGAGDTPVTGVRVVNNTLYGNTRWGLRIGASGAVATGTVVMHNLMQGNQAGGLTVGNQSTCGYVAGFNLNADGYGADGTPFNAYDRAADAGFVNPAGTDGVLGGSGYADDDFRLVQTGPKRSPAVNAGAVPAVAMGLSGTTHGDGSPDTGVVDIGFHYGASATQDLMIRDPYMPIFVRETGDDARDGLDPSRALRSIATAALRAMAGMTVVVGPGTYREGDIRMRQSAGRTLLQAVPSGRATGDLPGPVVVDATGFDTGFVVQSSCAGRVAGFHVRGAATAGIQVRDGAPDTVVTDNVVVSNQRRGIEVMGADAAVIDNNLVYANGTGGIRVTRSEGSAIVNNTVYANGDVGVLVGGKTVRDSAPGTRVWRNVVEANLVGVRLEVGSEAGYETGFNVVADGFAGSTPRADSDFVAPAHFNDPAGADGVLGGTGFADDDFRLRVGAAAPSPALDLDASEPHARASGTTGTDGLPDLGAVDAGYHYAFVPLTPASRRVAAVVYVRRGGDDADAGDVPERAKRTLAGALAAVDGSGMVVLGPGTYVEPSLRIGTADGFVVLVGDESGERTGDPAGPVVVDAAATRGAIVAGPVLLDGIVWTRARGAGLRVLGGVDDATVRNSVLCGNDGDGIVSMSDALTLVNNLICENRGIGVSLRLSGALHTAQVLNNTVAGNGRHGIVVHERAVRGGGTVLLYHNVIAGNDGAGLTAVLPRGARSAVGHNLNADGYGPRTRRGASDLEVDPAFSSAPMRGIGDCSATDGYALDAVSPAVDAGVGTPAGFGLLGRSVTGQAADVGATDLGYHYRGMP